MATVERAPEPKVVWPKDARAELLVYAADHRQQLDPELYALIRRACIVIGLRDVQVGKLRGVISERMGAEPKGWLGRARDVLLAPRYEEP